jgi:membrane protein implicated in regulation of membrane protease activity
LIEIEGDTETEIEGEGEMEIEGERWRRMTE